MSKVSFSRELLGTIRFIFDKTKSRTLNATQAYDISTSQIVLGSFPASASKKILTKDLGGAEANVPVTGTAAVNFTSLGAVNPGTPGTVLGKADRQETSIDIPASAIVSWLPEDDFVLKKSKNTPADPGGVSTAIFSGASAVKVLVGATDKSNATKDIFYGAITVGTGLYREWQGKYAVLKVDLLTNKAILRVYNE